MEKKQKEPKQHKNQYRAGQIAVKIMAAVLAVMMVLAVAATLIFYIIY